jgi:hypothetical protein
MSHSPEKLMDARNALIEAIEEWMALFAEKVKGQDEPNHFPIFQSVAVLLVELETME